MFAMPIHTHHRRRRFVAILLVLLLLAPHGQFVFPQNPPSSPSPGQDNVVRINTQLVQIDAVVTDKKGAHVDNLGASDFELFVDGKAQSLSHFSLVRLPASAKAAAQVSNRPGEKAAPAPVTMPSRMVSAREVKRTIAFVIDDLGLSFSSMSYAREAVKKFVDEQMQEGDLVGIIRSGRGLGALQQFTSDRRILYAAIDRLTYNPLSRDMMAKFGVNAPVTNTDDAAQQQTNNFDNFIDTSSSVGTLGALSFVVRSLKELPGRKVAVFVSDGFNMNGTSGDDTEVIAQMKDLIDQANRASVVIYSLDAKGLQTVMPKASDDMKDATDEQIAQQTTDALLANIDTQAGMVLLARETGGFAMINENDLDLGVKKAVADSNTYYLLGFDPEDAHFNGRYHSIRVRVKTPGLQVRTRGGFFGVNEADAAAARPQTPLQQMVATLYSPFGARDVHVQMTSFFVNSNAQGSYVRSFFYFDCSNLTFKDAPDKKKSLNLEIATFALNEEGETVDRYASNLSFDLDEAQYREAISKGLVRTVDVPIKKAGAYQFHSVIRDVETGRMGSSNQFIIVPDLTRKRITLSGLLISGRESESMQEAIMLKPVDNTDKIPEALNESQQRTLDPQPTAAVRRFATTADLSYGAWIFNATADKRTKLPQLISQIEIYHRGKRIYQAPAHTVTINKATNLKRIPCGGHLRLNEFPPGDFLLRLVVTDTLASEKVSKVDQWMDFSVRASH
jgi:VWFA-related protein